MKLLLMFLCLWTLAAAEGTKKDVKLSVIEYLIRLDKSVASLKSENQELKFHINTLDKSVASLKSENQELKSRMNTLENNGRGQVASFQVRQKGGYGLALGNKEVLKFDDVTLNTGSAYNPKSGIFIPPVTGTYFFWANIKAAGTNWFAITLQREGQELCRGYPGIKVNHGVAIITCLVKLKKGDHVWFANEEHHAKTVARGHKYSSYGGTLMYV